MTLCAAGGCPSFSTRVTSINTAAAAPVTETLRPLVNPALAVFSLDPLQPDLRQPSPFQHRQHVLPVPGGQGVTEGTEEIRSQNMAGGPS